MIFLEQDKKIDDLGYQLTNGAELSLDELTHFFTLNFADLYQKELLHLYFGRIKHIPIENLAQYAAISASQVFEMDKDKGFLNVIKSGGEIIAVGKCHFYTNYRTSIGYRSQIPTDAVFANFSVITSSIYQKKGLAKILLAKSILQTFGNEIPFVSSKISDGNTASLKLHASVAKELEPFVSTTFIQKRYFQEWKFVPRIQTLPEN